MRSSGTWSKRLEDLGGVAIRVLVGVGILLTASACGPQNAEQGNTNSATSAPSDVSTTPPLENGVRIVASGGGYYIVSKHTETYNSSFTEFGTVDSNGSWIHPLSKDHIFAQEPGKTDMLSGSTLSLAYAYLGHGMFLGTLGIDHVKPDGTLDHIGPGTSITGTMTCYIYNAKTDVGFSFSAATISDYVDGYLLHDDDDRYGANIIRIDENGDEQKLLNEGDHFGFGPYSEGLFFGGGSFYDINGKCVIPLDNIIDYSINVPFPFFQNGQTKIYMVNPENKVYQTTIDRTGKFLYDPVPAPGITEGHIRYYPPEMKFLSPSGESLYLWDTADEARTPGNQHYQFGNPPEQFTWQPSVVSSTRVELYVNGSDFGEVSGAFSLPLIKGQDYLLEFRTSDGSKYYLVCAYPDN